MNKQERTTVLKRLKTAT